VIDLCGFPKDSFFYYQAAWGDKPVLHLFPHWNWSGREGREINVWCHTNLDSVELFLNGVSLGAKRLERNSHLEWKAKYTPGVLEARGYKGGRLVLVDKRETTGEPAGIVLRPDRQRIMADGEDLSLVTVEVVDAHGRVMPEASNEVHFAITGPGRLIGVGNGDPSCHEPEKADRRRAFNGLCMALVQALQQPGDIRVETSAAGLRGASIVIRAEEAKRRPAVG
jgi:beta-galactosidase